MQNSSNVKTTTAPGRGPTLTILCYHAVTRENPPLDDYCFLKESIFRDHMQWLQRSRMDVLPLEQALDSLFEGQLQRNTVAITFDDGYLNNIDIALPILESLDLSATIFLTTGLTGTRSTLWPNRILSALQATEKTNISWNGEFVEWADDSGKARANARLQALVKQHAPDDPAAAAGQIETLLGAPIDPEISRKSAFAMMGPEDIERALESGSITFGAHTLWHPILSALSDDALENEISGSISKVEALTRTRCETFAYPNGQAKDFDNRAVSILNASPARYAVTTASQQNRAPQDPYRIARWTVGQGTSLRKLQARFWLARMSQMVRIS